MTISQKIEITLTSLGILVALIIVIKGIYLMIKEKDNWENTITLGVIELWLNTQLLFMVLGGL